MRLNSALHIVTMLAFALVVVEVAFICLPSAAQADEQPNALLLGQVDIDQVNGGQPFAVAWCGNTDSSTFATILEAELKERGLSGAGGGRFMVSAEMLAFAPDFDHFHFDHFATAVVRYRVTTKSDKALIFETTIRNTVRWKSPRNPDGSIPWSAGCLGGYPGRVAQPNSRRPADREAVRKNISQFLDALIKQAETAPWSRPVQ